MRLTSPFRGIFSTRAPSGDYVTLRPSEIHFAHVASVCLVAIATAGAPGNAGTAKPWVKTAGQCPESPSLVLKHLAKDRFWKVSLPIIESCTAQEGVPPDTLLSLALLAAKRWQQAEYSRTRALVPLFRKVFSQGGSRIDHKLLTALKGADDLSRWIVPALLSDYVTLQIDRYDKGADAKVPLSLPVPAATPFLKELSGNSPVYSYWQRMASFREQLQGREARSPGRASVSFQENQAAFWDVVLAYLDGAPAGESFEKSNAFRWSWGCGTGSETFRHAQALMEFSTLLEADDPAAAVGALIAAQSNERSLFTLGEDPFVQSRNLKRMLGFIGEPWQPLFLGLAAERNQEALELLVAEGDDFGARGILELAPLYAVSVEAYLDALAGFFPSQCRDSGRKSNIMRIRVRSGGMRPTRDGANPISQATQKMIIGKIAALATKVESGRVATHFAETLAKICHPALLPAGLALAALPYSEPGKILADYFSQHGVKLPQSKVSDKVEFELMLNGTPLADQPVNWEMHWPCVTEESCGSTSSSGAVTDAQGRISIDRDAILPGGRVVFSSSRLAQQDRRAYFYAPVELPQVILARVQVPIQAGALRIKFTSPAVQPLSAPHVSLHRGLHDWTRGGLGVFSLNQALSARHGFPDPEEGFFPVLPPESFTVCASGRGWKYTCVDGVVVNPLGTQVLEFSPERGADLTFRLWDRETKAEARHVRWVIEKQGIKENFARGQTQHSPTTILGLSKGDYSLVVKSEFDNSLLRFAGPATAEKVPESLRHAVPSPQVFATRRISFVIDENSPPVLDLGKIELTGIPGN